MVRSELENFSCHRASARCPTAVSGTKTPPGRAAPRKVLKIDADPTKSETRNHASSSRLLNPRQWIHAVVIALLCGFILSPRLRAQPPATAPARELNLLAMGDWGEGRPAQRKVADAMANYVQASKLHFDALLSAGDNF